MNVAQDANRGFTLVGVMAGLALGAILLALSFPALKQVARTTRDTLTRNELRGRLNIAREYIEQNIIRPQQLGLITPVEIVPPSELAKLLGKSFPPRPEAVGIKSELVLTGFPLRAQRILVRGSTNTAGIYCSAQNGLEKYKSFYGISVQRSESLAATVTKDKRISTYYCYRVTFEGSTKNSTGDLLVIFPMEDSIIIYLDRFGTLRRFSSRDRTTQPLVNNLSQLQIAKRVETERYSIFEFKVETESSKKEFSQAVRFELPLRTKTIGAMEDLLL